MKTIIKKYRTVNDMADACQKDWCIAPMPSSAVKQVKVKLNNGKSYDYACRYTLGENSVAVVGYPLARDSALRRGENTGAMGQVKSVSDKLTIKRDYALEVDYIFNNNPMKKDIAQCVKYLSLGEESYDKTLQFGKQCSPIRPIIYYIRRILAASSILAHEKMVKSEDMETARNTIFSNMTIDKKMMNLEWVLPENIGVGIADFHAPDENVITVFEQISKDLGGNDDWNVADGELRSMSDMLYLFSSNKNVNDFVQKYAHFGAVSLMVRGGFLNLLKAYLSANPPIAEYYDEMCQVLDGVGHKEAYEVLKAYNTETNA